ncbi:mobilization protein [Azorhizophilus paspali]|uniref:Mobilization protein n=1 Tax=Azorhizophilus paspali TaxID=69963 RepID=A0ABV6SJ04_AZOPA
MAIIHLVGGEKGGVGKSVVARLLAQYMIDRDLPFIGFDTDRSHGALLRYYGDYASPTVIDSYQSLDAILETASEQPERRILVDLAAQTHQPLSQWMEESGVLELAAELGIAIRYWNVMDSGQDSVNLLERLLDQFGARLDYVLVRNQVRDGEFVALDNSEAQQRAQDLNATVVGLKRLHPPLMNKIDRNGYSFWAARNRADAGSDTLNLLERQRLKVWLEHAYREIDAAQV